MVAGLRTVPVVIPEEMYLRLEKVASFTGLSISEVLLEAGSWFYTTSPTDREMILNQLETFSDAQLWAIVYQRFKPEDEKQFSALNDLVSETDLSASQQTQLEEFLHLMDYQVLLRSHALLLLKQRQQPIENYLNAPVL